MNNEQKRVDCRKCKSYYITWDRNFPYGCRIFQVKSRQMPNTVVFQSTGKPCECFQKNNRINRLSQL